MASKNNGSAGSSSKDSAKFLWKKGGPKPASRKNVDDTSLWLLQSSHTTANNLEVNFKVGSREFGLSASSERENKISEVALKRKYS